jgi:hypothetical protein
MVDLSGAAEATRQAEDAEDALMPRRTSELRFSHALDRIAAGTYTPPAYYRAPEPGYGCGTLDAYGRCAARYHGPHCTETVRGSAATSDATAAEAWNRALSRNTAIGDPALLANPLETSPEDLFGADGPADTEVLAIMRRQLGIGGKADLPARPAPSPMAERLGIW